MGRAVPWPGVCTARRAPSAGRSAAAAARATTPPGPANRPEGGVGEGRVSSHPGRCWSERSRPSFSGGAGPPSRSRADLCLQRHPEEPSERVSHETIYAYIYAQPRGELRKLLIGALRKAHKTRLPRSRGQDRRGRLRDMLSIHDRPVEVPVLTDDDPDRLAARVLTREHLIYPRVVGWFATGRLRLDEADRPMLDGRVLTHPVLLHPDGHCPDAGEAPEQAQA